MALSVQNLTKKYGEKVVVDNLNFEMSKPGVFALLGTNGAGKTTSIRVMLGMLAYDSGEVLWEGEPFDAVDMSVGYLPEERGLYPKYSLLDQLLYFAKLRNVQKKEAMDKIKHWSERLLVEEYVFPPKTKGVGKGKSNSAEQLSKGNQQKIQLMAALISDPKFLILDEPLSGLDPVNTDLFKEIIREEIAKDKYLIMSSHQMPTIEEFCSDIIIMDRGKTVLQGNLNEIKKGYGRINLFIKSDKDIAPYISEFGIKIQNKTPSEYHLKVQGEEQAMALLAKLIEEKIPVVKFELREPSLHEIFIEKVGNVHEDE
ncbi:ATP-binding cassette domain-containing protein [Herbivorax sp. ANBcel31]|uniref:ABC transporter ATP-binding protein n=1 Tax=Herbivorax sp. ANBcel31 TaxID=3069754 RepID=UPI0027B597B4|nr:ATP-binding cassette domain-containing protein [Herbivorax sp. ANBcel31]MDQ2088041.1 ATP-binding cassette domain-containing protein [Herbivorax sp. ANBcel31]